MEKTLVVSIKNAIIATVAIIARLIIIILRSFPASNAPTPPHIKYAIAENNATANMPPPALSMGAANMHASPAPDRAIISPRYL